MFRPPALNKTLELGLAFFVNLCVLRRRRFVPAVAARRCCAAAAAVSNHLRAAAAVIGGTGFARNSVDIALGHWPLPCARARMARRCPNIDKTLLPSWRQRQWLTGAVEERVG